MRKKTAYESEEIQEKLNVWQMWMNTNTMEPQNIL